MADQISTRSLDEPFILDIKVDRDSPVALHQQISGPLEDAILKGTILPGQTIENEVSLASRLELSRPTVRRAFQDLVTKGLLSRRRGVGTRVSPRPIQRQVKLSSLNDDLLSAGRSTRTEVLKFEVRFADKDISKKLDCKEGDEIVFFERLRWLDDFRLALMHNYVPSDLAPSLTELARDGFYQSLKARGVQLQSGYQQIGAKSADDYEASILHIEPGAALVTMKRTSFDASGRIVEYAHHCYDAKQYEVTMPLSAA